MAVKQTTTRRTAKGTKIDFMKAVNNVGQPMAAVGGFALGKIALKKLSGSGAVSGLMGTETKEYVLPAAVALGGLVGTQFTKNPYVTTGLIGVSGAGLEAIVKKATGKTVLSGLEGLMGEGSEQMAIPGHHVEIPAADLDIEEAVREAAAYQGAPVEGAGDLSLSDEPVSGASDFSLSDEPVGSIPEYEEAGLFEGDMLAD
jgi:hypothetical protein